MILLIPTTIIQESQRLRKVKAKQTEKALLERKTKVSTKPVEGAAKKQEKQEISSIVAKLKAHNTLEHLGPKRR